MYTFKSRHRLLNRVTSPVFASLVATLLLLGLTTPAHAEEWRIGTLAPDGSSWMKVLSKGVADVNAKTSGRVKFKYFTGGSQGNEGTVISKLKVGGLDGGAFTSVGLGQIVPSIRVLELPRLFNSIEEMDYVRNRMWGTFMKRFKEKGYILLAPGDVGNIYLYTNTPIKSIADLKKTSMWLRTDDPMAEAMYTKLGVKSVPMGVPNVLPALNTGRINGCYGSPVSMVALQWFKKVRYATSMPVLYAHSATVIRKEVWDKMSPEDTKAVKESTSIHAKELRKTIRKDNERNKKTLVRNGIKVIETPAEVVAEFEKHAQAVWKENVGKLYSQKDLDRVLKYREEFRAKNK